MRFEGFAGLRQVYGSTLLIGCCCILHFTFLILCASSFLVDVLNFAFFVSLFDMRYHLAWILYLNVA